MTHTVLMVVSVIDNTMTHNDLMVVSVIDNTMATLFSWW